jgi:benzoate/toluate 1,2-dioxygenase beta subunit
MHPVEALIHREARLLDARAYPDWIALFTQDARYWVPVSPAMETPQDGPSHILDDPQLLRARTHRLLNPRAFGAEPGPRTAHLISGIEISENGDSATATSTQLMLEWRPRGRFEADQRLFGGLVTHQCRREAGDWRIASKRVDLINAEGSFAAILAPI